MINFWGRLFCCFRPNHLLDSSAAQASVALFFLAVGSWPRERSNFSLGILTQAQQENSEITAANLWTLRIRNVVPRRSSSVQSLAGRDVGRKGSSANRPNHRIVSEEEHFDSKPILKVRLHQKSVTKKVEVFVFGV